MLRDDASDQPTELPDPIFSNLLFTFLSRQVTLTQTRPQSTWWTTNELPIQYFQIYYLLFYPGKSHLTLTQPQSTIGMVVTAAPDASGLTN
ncbi:MAG: hypothetical protein IPI77_13015 [Saprospiraceae bacterium]|nr:hypothetical protein [Saprospiraceae bacterium]